MKENIKHGTLMRKKNEKAVYVNEKYVWFQSFCCIFTNQEQYEQWQFNWFYQLRMIIGWTCGICNSENFHGHLSSSWVLARSFHLPRPLLPKGAPCSHRGVVTRKWPSCWPCYEFAGSRHHISIEDRKHHFIGHFDPLAEPLVWFEFIGNAPQCYQLHW